MRGDSDPATQRQSPVSFPLVGLRPTRLRGPVPAGAATMKRTTHRANTLPPRTPAHPGLRLLAIALPIALAGTSSVALADDPCGELSECVLRIEINATDGDIGLGGLVDADGWKEV